MAWQKDQSITGEPKMLARYRYNEGGSLGSPLLGPGGSGSPLINFPNVVRHSGGLIYVTNVGSPSVSTVAVSDGSNWIDLTTGLPFTGFGR